MQNEKQIIIEIKKGDKNAFRKLLNHYHDSIMQFTYSLIGCKDDAQDITQEAFIKAWNKIDRFNINKSFRPWIFKITHNLCKDYWKNYSSKNKRDSAIYSDENTITNSKEKTDIGYILSTLNILPKKQKIVFILRDLQDLNVADVAAIMNISQSSVKTNLFHARKSLQKHLLRQEDRYEL